MVAVKAANSEDGKNADNSEKEESNKPTQLVSKQQQLRFKSKERLGLFMNVAGVMLLLVLLGCVAFFVVSWVKHPSHKEDNDQEYPVQEPGRHAAASDVKTTRQPQTLMKRLNQSHLESWKTGVKETAKNIVKKRKPHHTLPYLGLKKNKPYFVINAEFTVRKGKPGKIISFPSPEKREEKLTNKTSSPPGGHRKIVENDRKNLLDKIQKSLAIPKRNKRGKKTNPHRKNPGKRHQHHRRHNRKHLQGQKRDNKQMIARHPNDVSSYFDAMKGTFRQNTGINHRKASIEANIIGI
ncbi:unnamed protein product [Clavelina lepadiformis]|uniref:Uncharacterized protein n=1 Tax=Clavelina lepadiformis TaxID=159417 RepID=A0ABP0EYM4_CLALP